MTALAHDPAPVVDLSGLVRAYRGEAALIRAETPLRRAAVAFHRLDEVRDALHVAGRSHLARLLSNERRVADQAAHDLLNPEVAPGSIAKRVDTAARAVDVELAASILSVQHDMLTTVPAARTEES